LCWSCSQTLVTLVVERLLYRPVPDQEVLLDRGCHIGARPREEAPHRLARAERTKSLPSAGKGIRGP